MAKLTAYLVGSPGQALGIDITSWNPSELGGNPLFIFEDTVSVDRLDVTSLQNLDIHGLDTVRDYAFVRQAIYDEMIAQGGYSTLSDDDKKVCLRWFVAGGGNDYVDALYTQAEYAVFHTEVNERLDKAFKTRDEIAFRFVQSEIYHGSLAKANADIIGETSINYRNAYVHDRRKGKDYGDTQNGICDWIANTYIFKLRNVTAVNTGTKTFTISGSHADKTNDVGQFIQFIGGTGSPNNDGYYTIVSATDNGGNTDIVVEEAIVSSDVEGQLYINGCFSIPGTDVNFRDTALSIYLTGQ